MLGKVDGAEVVRGLPVRTMPTWRGQQYFPCLLLTAHPRLPEGVRELAGAGPAVASRLGPVGSVGWRDNRLAVAAGGSSCRHVPDFLVEMSDGSYTVIDVKPQDLFAEQSGRRGSCLDRGGSPRVNFRSVDPNLVVATGPVRVGFENGACV